MSILEISAAECMDCYKCVRSCPVKAIKIQNGRAQVWEEKCILDGGCLKVCPQRAKRVRNDIPAVKQMLSEGWQVAASIAPSFVLWPKPDYAGKLVSAVRQLGFSWIESTAVTASAVAKAHARLLGDNVVLSSSCPVIVNLVEKHYPSLLPYLAPVASPMVAHGRLLKKTLGEDWKVVFIGPCLAKKWERDNTTNPGVDAVLTFSELWDWLAEAGIAIADCPDSPLDGSDPGIARLFPLAGGLLKAAGLSTDSLSDRFTTVTGIHSCIAFLEELVAGRADYRFVEMLACEGGCINGPFMDSQVGTFERSRIVLGTAASVLAKSIEVDSEMLEVGYCDRSVRLPVPTERDIEEILHSIGKYSSADELNCGACGYDSCREKARAVYWGVAEREMCLPYMRRKAESFAEIILTSTPNGILVVDTGFRILDINPAAEGMFSCHKDEVLGRCVDVVISRESFERALRENRLIVETMYYPKHDLHTRQYVFHLQRENVLIAIVCDISDENRQKRALASLQEETIARAQEVIDKQMRVAQEIAGLLGETTAETKVILTKLMQLIRSEGESSGLPDRGCSHSAEQTG